MTRIFWVAWREFSASVFNKAFLLGLLMPPIIGGLMTLMLPMLMNSTGPKVKGHVAIIDRSGLVAERFAKDYKPGESQRKIKEKLDQATAVTGAMPPAAKATMQAALEEPDIHVVTLPATADAEVEKKPILAATGKEKDAQGTDPRLALVVVPPEAVVKPTDLGPDGKPKDFASFNFYVAPRLDFQVQQEIENQVQRSIVDARLEARKFDVADIRSLMDRPEADTKAVTAEGEKDSNDALKLLLPGAFMFLMFMGVMVCGQGLLSSTIEEKSSRVMELLLSAVTPMQLMVGKIIGQMAVGTLLLGVYTGAGVAALAFFALMANLDLMNLVWLAVFFLIAFGMIASMFAAVGSAVNDVKEAQTLQTPLMMVMMIPLMLWMPIMRNPNSMFAQIMSFVPPASPFVMMLRLAGSEKLPAWQLPASIVVGFLSVAVFMWAAAKIFRIGVLMYGKPPNILTLLKWIRMA